MRMTFCDVDFERGSRAHGKGAPPAPPEGWVIGRAGLVHATWDGAGFVDISSELIEGRRCASRLVGALDQGQLVVGHGLLTADLRAAAMVTEIPGSLISRSVDTLLFVHQTRGGRLPVGCGLSKLVELNTGQRRTKPAVGSSAPRLRPGIPKASARRGDADPRDDAVLVQHLWSAMVTQQRAKWAGGEVSWTHYDGDSRPGAPSGQGELNGQQLSELIGAVPMLSKEEWLGRIRFEGRVLRPAVQEWGALALGRFGTGQLPEVSRIRELADHLRAGGLIPSDYLLQDEDLLTACQYLGVNQNIDVRERLTSGRAFNQANRGPLAWALWQITHQEWVRQYWSAYCESEASVASWMMWSTLRAERKRIRAQVELAAKGYRRNIKQQLH